MAKTEDNIERLMGFLDKNKIAHSKEFGEYAAFNVEITAVDLPGFFSFLTEQLHAPERCLLFPYQTLCEW